MAQFYSKKGAFVQGRQTPPGGFAPLKENGGGGGVMALLENIIAESKETEEDALKAENDAQAAYETFVKDTNKAIADMQVQITNDEENEATDKKKEVEDEGDKRAT